MRFYPIFLDLRGKRCVVVGGGRVAERKVRALARAGAAVHVISPSVTPRLAILAARKKIALTPRVYRKGDLRAGALPQSGTPAPLLVFAATSDPEVQRSIQEDAKVLGALVNAADDPARSGFIVPASFSQGDLHVAISTSAASPALARRLRRQLQQSLGRKYRAYLRLLRAVRAQVMKTISGQKQRAKVFRRLSSSLDGALLKGPPRADGEIRKLVERLAGKEQAAGRKEQRTKQESKGKKQK